MEKLFVFVLAGLGFSSGGIALLSGLRKDGILYSYDGGGGNFSEENSNNKAIGEGEEGPFQSGDDPHLHHEYEQQHSYYYHGISFRNFAEFETVLLLGYAILSCTIAVLILLKNRGPSFFFKWGILLLLVTTWKEWILYWGDFYHCALVLVNYLPLAAMAFSEGDYVSMIGVSHYTILSFVGISALFHLYIYFFIHWFSVPFFSVAHHIFAAGLTGFVIYFLGLINKSYQNENIKAISTLSHELRTPLHGIIGATHMLATIPETSPQQQRYLSIIRACGLGLNAIVNNLLDTLCIDIRKPISVSNRSFDILCLLQELADSFGHIAYNYGIKLNIVVETKVTLEYQFVYGDPKLLSEVIVILLLNSLKMAACENVTMYVKCSPTKHYYDSNEYQLEFSVSDRGTGNLKTEKDVDDFHRLLHRYDPFRYERRKGLGMNVAKYLANLMKGDVSVERFPDEGSNLKLVLPLRKSILADPIFDYTIQKNWIQGLLNSCESLFVGTKTVVVVTKDNTLSQMQWIAHFLNSVGIDTFLYDLRTIDSQQMKEISRCSFDIIFSDGENVLQDHIKSKKNHRTVHNLSPFLVLISEMYPIAKSDELKDFHLVEVRPITPFRMGEILNQIVNYFISKIPAPSAESHEPVVPGSMFPHFGIRSVLIVEDNMTNQVLLKTFLSKCNLHCDVANNGKEGVEYFMQRPYDLIMMDIQMPIMDGLEATKKIRQLESQLGKSRTWIVALSGLCLYSDEIAALNAGCNFYMTKPLNLATLEQTLCQTIRLKNAHFQQNLL